MCEPLIRQLRELPSGTYSSSDLQQTLNQRLSPLVVSALIAAAFVPNAKYQGDLQSFPLIFTERDRLIVDRTGRVRIVSVELLQYEQSFMRAVELLQRGEIVQFLVLPALQRNLPSGLTRISLIDVNGVSHEAVVRWDQATNQIFSPV